MWTGNLHKEKYKWALSLRKGASLPHLCFQDCHLHLAGKREGKKKTHSLTLEHFWEVCKVAMEKKNLGALQGGLIRGCLPPNSELYRKGPWDPPQVLPQKFWKFESSTNSFVSICFINGIPHSAVSLMCNYS